MQQLLRLWVLGCLVALSSAQLCRIITTGGDAPRLTPVGGALSSIYQDNDNTYGWAVCQDGNYGNFCHTTNEAQPWIRLSYDQSEFVDHVVISLRARQNSVNPLSDFELWVGNDDSAPDAGDNTKCFSGDSQNERFITVACRQEGQHLFLRKTGTGVLNLHELEGFGTPPIDDCQNGDFRVQVNTGLQPSGTTFEWTVLDVYEHDYDTRSTDGYYFNQVSLSSTNAATGFVVFDRSEDHTRVSCSDYTARIKIRINDDFDCIVSVFNRDTTAPVLGFKSSESDPSTPQSSVQAYESYEIQDLPAAKYGVATDACGGTIDVEFLESVSMDLKENTWGERGLYSLQRSWIATDQCGNVGNTYQTVDVYDVTPPVIQGPPDSTLACDDIIPGCALTVTDNSAQDAWISNSETTFSSKEDGCEYNYVLKRAWTATDHSGNIANFEQEIQVVDNEPPQINGFNTTDRDWPCEVEYVPQEPVVNDNCDKLPSCDHEVEVIGTVRTHTYCCHDKCGNSRCMQKTHYIIDDTPPYMPNLTDVTESCSEGFSPTQRGQDCNDNMITDNCDIEPRWDLNNVRIPGSCPFAYEYNQTYSAIDNAGNFATVHRVITVIDDTTPTMTPDVSDHTVNCTISNATVRNAHDPCEPDAFGTANITQWDDVIPTDISSALKNYQAARHWSVTDSCGNNLQETITVTVVDDEPPVMTDVPADTTVNCDVVPPADNLTVTVKDNCCAVSEIDVQYTEVRTNKTCRNEYVLERTWTATDCAGNFVTKKQTIVVDFVAITLDFVPADMDIEWAHGVDQHPRNDTTFIQACLADDMVYTPVETPLNCDHNYNITRTWSIVDGCQDISHTQTITVRDTTAPVIVGFVNQTTTCSASDEQSDLWGVTAYDPNYGGNASGVIIPTLVCTDDVAHDHVGGETLANIHQAEFKEAKPAEFNGVQCGPSKCFDGESTLSTLCSGAGNSMCASGTETDQYLKMDLGETKQLTKVVIHARLSGTAAEKARLGHHQIWVGSNWDDATGAGNTMCAESTADTSTIITSLLTCSGSGRYVWILQPGADRQLFANEVEVFIDVPAQSCSNTASRTCTFTAIDHCANNHTETVTETWDDNSRPVIDEASKNATDNCMVPNVLSKSRNDSDVYGRCGIERIQVDTWYTEDNCGNEAIDVVTYTDIWDLTPPAFAGLPDDVTLVCQDTPEHNVSYPHSGIVSVTDNNDASGTFPIADEAYTTRNESVVSCGRIHIRTWNVTDCNDNTQTHEQSITVAEPVEEGVSSWWKLKGANDTLLDDLPADYTMECPDIPTFPTLVAQTACGGSVDVVGSTGPAVGIPNTVDLVYTHTWTWTDGCQSLNHTQVVTVLDTLAPEFNITDDTQNCSHDDTLLPEKWDRCDTQVDCTKTDVWTGEAADMEYYITRTWTCVDDQGLQTVKNQTLTAVDDENPQFENTPADETVDCSHTPDEVRWSDNCDATSLVVNATKTGNVTDYNGAYEYTWDITDHSGNPNQHVQNVKVEDVDVPTFTFEVADATIDCFEDLLDPVIGSAADNCELASITNSSAHNQPDCAHQGYTVHTWVATDVSGLTNNKTQTIYYDDRVLPTIDDTFPTVTVEWFTDVEAMFSEANITSTTDCGVFADLNITCDYTNNGPTATCSRTHEWDCTIIDECGNTKVYNDLFVVTEIDTRVPVITPKYADVNLMCVDYPNHPTLPASNTTTNVEKDTVLNATWVGDTEDDYSCKILTRIYTLDWCGRSDNHTQYITVHDKGAPLLSNIPAYPSDECNIPPKGTPDSVDKCGGVFTPEITDVNTTIDRGHSFIRTVQSADHCGNTNIKTYNFTVADITFPSFSTPAPNDTSVEAPTPPEDFVNRTGTDNCNVVTYDYNETNTPEGCPGNFTRVRNWKITDDVGNFVEQVQTIVSRDSTLPYWTSDLPADVTTTYEIHVHDNSTTFNATVLTASDANDGTMTVVFNETESRDPTLMNNFVLTRVWTVTDACGHEISHTQAITVTSPEPCEPPNETYECSTAIENITSAEFYKQNCSEVMQGNVNIFYVETTQAGSCEDAWLILRTYTLTDDEGINKIDVDQTVTMQDTTAPTFAVEDHDTTREYDLDANNCDRPAPPVKVASDNCDDNVTVVDVHTEIDEFSHLYTYTATDNCGHQATTTHRDTLKDKRYVEWLTELDADTGVCSEPNVTTTPVCKGVCGKNCTVSRVADIVLTESCPRTIVRVWDTTDDRSFKNTTTQTITVDDNVAPVVTTDPDCDTECYDTCTHYANATDNCDGLIEVSGPNCTGDKFSGACNFTATDDCGNLGWAIQSHTHKRITSPNITYAPATYNATCTDPVGTHPQLTALDDCDAANVIINYVDTNVTGTDCENDDILTTVNRTWTVTDQEGESSYHSHLVYIKDLSDPVFFNAPDDGTSQQVQCTNPTWSVTVQDTCSTDGAADPIEPVRVNLTGYDAPSEYYTLTWNYTDTCGKSLSVEHTVLVHDTQPPSFITNIPATGSVLCGDDVPAAMTVTSQDNCGTPTQVLLNDTSTGSPCDVGGTVTTRTWVITDATGNSYNESRVFTKAVQVSPVCTITNASQTKQCPIALDDPVVTCTDPCTGLAVSYETTKSMTDSCGNTTSSGTWTMLATESVCNLTHSVTQTRVSEDTNPPNFTFVPNDVTSVCTVAPFDAPICDDDCDSSPVITSVNNTVPNGCTDVHQYAYKCTDACGLTDEHTVKMTTLDEDPPVFSNMDNDTTIECPAVYTRANVTANDQCDADTDVVVADVQILPGTGNVVRYEVYNFTATDTCGNAHSEATTVTIKDTTAPTFGNNTETLVIGCQDTPDLSLDKFDACSDGDATVSAPVMVRNETNPENCGETGLTVYNWTLTDAYANVNTISRSVWVIDITPPSMSFTAGSSGFGDVTLECDQTFVPPSCTVTDDCTPNLSCTEENATRIDLNSINNTNEFAMEYKWTAMDQCGNSVSKRMTVTYEDTNAPTLDTDPVSQTLDCTAASVTLPNPDISDDCDASPTHNDPIITNSSTCNGEVTKYINYTWADVDGNTDWFNITVFYEDVTGPTLTVNGTDQTVLCSAIPAAPTATADDDCGDAHITPTAPTITSANDSCSYDYVKTFHFVTVDDCGNAGDSQDINYTVYDDQKPTFAHDQGVGVGALPDTTVPAGQQFPGLPIVYPEENCGNATITFDYTTETIISGCEYKHIRSWDAVDVCGNTDRLEQVIYEVENSSPTFDNYEEHVTVECGNYDWDAGLVHPTATDRVGHHLQVNRSISLISTAPDCACQEVHHVTWTTKDACGNTATKVSTVNIIDSIPPQFTCDSNDLSLECSSEIPDTKVISAVDASFAGPKDCTVSDEVLKNVTGCDVQIVRTYYIEDCSNNVASRQQTITVLDNAAPRFTRTPIDRTVECGCDDIPEVADIDAIDNCDGSLSVTPTSTGGTTSFTENNTEVGILYRQYSTTDTCGNSKNHTQTITIQDTKAPTLSCTPDDKQVSCESDEQTQNVTAADECDASVTSTVLVTTTTAGSCDNEYTMNNTWTATDSVGNSVSHTQVVEVIDNTPPALLQIPGAAANCLAPTGNTYSVAIVDMFQSYDNCDDGASTDINIVSCNSTGLGDGSSAFPAECKESADGQNIEIVASTDGDSHRTFYIYGELIDACSNSINIAYSIDVMNTMQEALDAGCESP